MNDEKPKFRYVLFNENRVFVHATLLFMCVNLIEMFLLSVLCKIYFR